MGVFAHGWFFDFVMLGVLVARFAQFTGSVGGFCWPAIGLHIVAP